MSSAQAATGLRVDLRVLVIADGSAGSAAIATQLDTEGVPYTAVDLTSAARPTITDAFLANSATGEGLFQAVVMPNQTGGLSLAEQTALSAYERSYGVRQVDAYVYPGAATGQAGPAYSGVLDGATATVTPAGLAGPFSYLKGALPIDNADPAVTEVYGYLAAPAAGLPAGQSFTSLLDVTVGSSKGSVVGVYAHDFREELVVTAAFNSNQQAFREIGHGIVTWMTRGLHLGYHRNYFDVQIDDIFLADALWSSTGHCTPGDDASCVDPAATNIQMTSADVTRLLAWQNANGFKLDMVYNASGSGGASDPLAVSLLAAQSNFTWINHTWSHVFLGCIEVAPVVAGSSWHCATTQAEVDLSGESANATLVGGVYWHSQAAVTSEIQQNQAWATAEADELRPARAGLR